MPVVPFTPGPKIKGGRQLLPPPAEPFALMAAAQIHSEGRLLHPDIDDRRNQSLEEMRYEIGKDALRNAMVPQADSPEPTSRIAKALGADDIGGREVAVYDSTGKRLKKD